jgi:hypothetical protein
VQKHSIEPPWPPHYPPVVWDTYYIFFSTVSFLYIQPSTLFPIANSMKEPRKFNMVQVLEIVLSCRIFCAISFFFEN